MGTQRRCRRRGIWPWEMPCWGGAQLTTSRLLAHAVVAVADDRFVGVELLEIRGNRAHGDEDGTFDAALGVFPGFAHVYERVFRRCRDVV